jgi:uncharacterized protein
MEHLNVKLQVKSLDEAGKFSGLASVYGNVDLGGDVVEPGAFTKSIVDRGGEVPLLFHHDTSQPIGVVKLQDTSAGLMVEGQLVLATVKGAESYALLKARALRGLSIGYSHVKSVMVAGVRRLREVKLHEVSLVSVPMNELALVTAVKADDGDIAEQVQLFRQVLQQCRKDFRF